MKQHILSTVPDSGRLMGLLRAEVAKGHKIISVVPELQNGSTTYNIGIMIVGYIVVTEEGDGDAENPPA